MPQPKINRLLIEKAKNNEVVVRLKGGDSFLFGRGGEETEACVEAGVDFKVIPGEQSHRRSPSMVRYHPNTEIVHPMLP